jgi:uncharacterized lipoprotein YajG
MSTGNESQAGPLRATGALVAASVLLSLLVGCAPGMQNVLVDLRPYEPQGGNPPASLAKVRIEPVKDARGDAVGGMIGERTTIGNVSMGGIDLNPPPTDVIARVLKTEFTQMGYRVASAEEQFTIGARLRKFQVLTPATVMYWDINGTIELELAVTSRDGRQHESRYAVTCTDRSYVWPSEALIGGVVAACVGEIGARLRGDETLAMFIGKP